ncbi:MAG: polyphosphate polymerase domain-containing protein [Clostridia bacterium]|nr:polyphosphate polymerase domain-containing protein [Clostridia bacterium]
MPQTVFRRQEFKYLITHAQKEKLLSLMDKYIVPDEYGRSTVCSIYYDTPTSMLIRRSIESPIYKEKLRVRSYGRVNKDDTVYVEIKKKFKHIVYKRRVGIPLGSAERWLSGDVIERAENIKPRTAQIMNEIDFFISRYSPLEPAMFISAEREAFYAANDREFRITFDENILSRSTELSLSSDIYGTPILPDGMVLMELKSGTSLPLPICHALCDEGIFKTKFSKYGTAYKNALAEKYITGDTDNEFIQGIV